jgi:hypothetical protein
MSALLTWLTGGASPFALVVGKWAAIAITISLFLLSLRRSGERAGRMAERLKIWRKPMKSNAGCSRPRLAGLAIVSSLLSACATVSSERVVGVCPPVVGYDDGVQARTAEEVQALPDGSVVVELLSDYAVMRERARGCVFP